MCRSSRLVVLPPCNRRPALAWLLQRAPNILLIPGTSTVQHLRENLASASLELSQHVVTRLDKIAADAPG
jgi:pyridoxine 4-dehydrogenase